MTKNESLIMKLDRIETELRMTQGQIKKEQKFVEQLRQQRAKIYEQEAAQDTAISQKFDGYKTPSSVDQKHYDGLKAAIKAVYYTIRESPNGLGPKELKYILATRTDKEITDAVWFLKDRSDIQGPTLDWKWKVEK